MYLSHAISVTSHCPESTGDELGFENWKFGTCEQSSFDWTLEKSDLLNHRERSHCHFCWRITCESCYGRLPDFPSRSGLWMSFLLTVRKHYRFDNEKMILVKKYRFIRI